jgi:hypothetical protein
MRAAVAVVVVAACGRFDFDPRSGQQLTGSDAPSSALSVTAVAPTWLMDGGGDVTVTVAGDTAGVVLAVDGLPCSPQMPNSDGTLACHVVAHAPGSVAVTATNTAGDAGTWTGMLAFLTPGMYQVGSSSDDNTSGVAVDRDGNIFVTGGTTGNFDGTNQGGWDAMLVKYDVTGKVAWIRQLGTAAYDYSRDVAVDPQGNATIAGYTAGALQGTNAGSNDVFIARYAPDGTLLWVTQTGSTGDDQAWDVAVDDAGNTVVAIQTSGVLGATSAGGIDYAIAHYTPTGALDWVQQGGSAADDFGHSVTVTPDGVAYLVGYTTGSVEAGHPNAGGLDMFVARYELDGSPAWIHQRGGAGDEYAQDVMYDPTSSGGVWVVGSASNTFDGQPNNGSTDVFLASFSAAGAWQLTRTFGGTGVENSWGVGIADDGTVYVQCVATAAFDGQAYVGGAEDFCMAAFDHAGNHLWTRIAGTSGNDQSSSCFVDRGRTGFVYMSLITDNSLDGMANRGGNDVGLVKLDSTGAIQ